MCFNTIKKKKTRETRNRIVDAAASRMKLYGLSSPAPRWNAIVPRSLAERKSRKRVEQAKYLANSIAKACIRCNGPGAGNGSARTRGGSSGGTHHGVVRWHTRRVSVGHRLRKEYRLLVPALEAVCLDTGIVINDGMNKPLTSISAPAKCFVSLATTATSSAVLL